MNEAVIVRSRWTPDDEARLKELAERKARIYSDNIGLLSEALSGCTESFVLLSVRVTIENYK